jgi:hypothetical protein
MLANGKYEYCITGVMRKDKNGNALKTKSGNAYAKVKLCILDAHNQSHNVYDLVFNREKIEQIVDSIGKVELKKQTQDKEFKLENLIGESGRCLTKIRPGKDNYPDSIGVECYLKPISQTLIQENVVLKQEQSSNSDEDFDDIPF